MATTVANLQQSFAKEQYSLVNDQFAKLDAHFADRLETFKSVHDAVAKDLSSQQEAQYKSEQDTIKNKLESDKFTWQQKKDIADNAIAQGKLSLDEAKAAQDNATGNLLGMASPVAKLPDGTYDTASQEALLAKFSPTEAAMIRKIGEYDMDISKVTSLAGGKRENLAAKVALVYPNFDMKNYATMVAYKKNLANTTQGSAGGAINSANKVINHLTEYIDSVSNIPGNYGFSSTMNAIRNKMSAPFSPALQEVTAEANTAAIGVKDELAKFFKGAGVADVHSIEDWSKALDINATPATQRGTVQAAVDLLQGQLVPMMDQYKQTMGQEPPEGLFLKSTTKGKLTRLKNEGYKIEIPGVHYTDKSSWQTYGRGTAEEWNGAVDKLNAIGAPLTDENILQAVQSI